jgi:cytochrome bd-type quinol oxidase subunit 2
MFALFCWPKGFDYYKQEDPRWRKTWGWVLPAWPFGVPIGNQFQGLPFIAP